MKQLTVISGKGGTGKTTIVASFASLAKNLVIADCDVDAPDLHLILKPKILEKEKFFGLKIPMKDESLCIKCGKCKEVCKFDAIDENFKVNELKCEGCGACVFICPTKAFKFITRESGKLYISETRFGPFVHALLKIGEEASGKLVSKVREKAKEISEKENKELILIDGSPGIGCPVIASIGGVDLTLIITEPTISGFHDLERILKVTRHFKIQSVVCINKFNINENFTRKIEKFCKEKEVKIIGKIPYDTTVTKAMVEGKSIIEFDRNRKVSKEIEMIWGELYNILNLK
jgi:MinD superfamily P-loop ATPase